MMKIWRRLLERLSAARAERRSHREIYKVRRTWLASGYSASGDAGSWEIPNATRDEAMARIGVVMPNAKIVHIDILNWIITYRT